MQKIAALIFVLAACADDTPTTGTWYQCKGQLVCDGERFGITGQTCSDADSVEEDYIYFSTKWAEHQGVKCAELDVVDVVCEPTHNLCSY